MARTFAKSRGGSTAGNIMTGGSQQSKPTAMTPAQYEASTGNKLIDYATDQYGNLDQGNMKIRLKEFVEKDKQAAANQLNQSSIGDSYNKMIGQYEPDISKYTGMLPSTNQFTEQPGKNGFYGSMSGLEGASMRLANAASQRSMAEAGYGSGLKRGETANEYGLRDISTAKEYGLKGGLLNQEYGLKGGLIGQEYGLRGMQTAQSSGYSSPQQMQQDLKNQREKEDAYKKALASGQKGTFSSTWGSFTI